MHASMPCLQPYQAFFTITFLLIEHIPRRMPRQLALRCILELFEFCSSSSAMRVIHPHYFCNLCDHLLFRWRGQEAGPTHKAAWRQRGGGGGGAAIMQLHVARGSLLV